MRNSWRFLLFGSIFFLFCQNESTHNEGFGIWKQKEQCFGKTSPICADLEKEETESFWVFVNSSELRMNQIPCQHSLLGENLKVLCHGMEPKIYEIIHWDAVRLELYDQQKEEFFRFIR